MANAINARVADVTNERMTHLHVEGRGPISRPCETYLHGAASTVVEALVDLTPLDGRTGDPAQFQRSRSKSRSTWCRLPAGSATPAWRDLLVALADEAHLEEEFTGHVLRHTFGTTQVRAGHDLVLVAELMGHRRLETTRGYTRPGQVDCERAIHSLPTDR